jgi:hypothetical protein
MESVRTATGRRKHTIATLSKLPGLDARYQSGWGRPQQMRRDPIARGRGRQRSYRQTNWLQAEARSSVSP